MNMGSTRVGQLVVMADANRRLDVIRGPVGPPLLTGSLCPLCTQ